jgi:integrase
MKPEDKQLRDALLKPIEEATRAAQDALNRTLRERIAREKAAAEGGQPTSPVEREQQPSAAPDAAAESTQVAPQDKPAPKKRRRKKLPRGIFEGKDGWYWIRYADRHGRIHREKGSPMLEGAKAALEKRRTEVREGKFFPEKVRQHSILFGELATDYLKLARGRKRSWEQDEDHIETLSPILKEIAVADLTAGRLESALADIAEEREWAPATFNRYKATVSGIFQLAMLNGKAQTNPARQIRKREENDERVRFLTVDEERALMDVVRSECPERELEIITAIHSGMRRSEQYRTAQVPDGGLKWEYINFRAGKHGVIRLPRSKGNKPREIPMNSVLHETLRSIPQRIDSPYVFEGTDPAKWFAKLLQAAGIKNFVWHDLRHTFGSRLAMKGVPILQICKLMGHSDVKVTMRYAHLQPGHLADAVEKLETPDPAQNDAQTDTATDTSKITVSKKAG